MRKLWIGCCSIKGLTVITAALIVTLAGVLVLSFYGIPQIINKQIDDSVELKQGTKQWDRFVNLPIPLVTKIFLYHVTNPDDILNGKKPIIEERGPYVYNQIINRTVIDLDNSEDSVTYRKFTTQEFNKELSENRTEDDEITVLNPALLVLTQITSTVEQFVVKGCLSKIFRDPYDKMFITTTIKVLMFEGFIFAEAKDDVGYACNIIRQQVIEKTAVMKNIQRIYDPSTGAVSSLKFSYLGFKVNAPDGIYTVNRGINDVSKLGSIMRWNQLVEVPYWGTAQSINNETCKRVRGGDSTIYPPKVTTGMTFETFSTDICRSVELYFSEESSYKGITGYRFEPSEDTFRPSTANAENDCYCTKKTLNQKGEATCFLDGILDVYECFGAPLLLSFPHFLHADEKYLNVVENLSPPNKSIHGIYLLIEPNTGTPLQGKKRVQLNMVLRPTKYIGYGTLASTILPILWLDEGVDLTDDLVDELNTRFFKMIKIADGIKYGLIAVSGASVLITGGLLFRKTCC